MAKHEIPCCECGTPIARGPLDGRRCELCSQENYVNWLVRLGQTTRDGEPDGHTPAMRPGQREKHNQDIAEEKKKLKALRLQFPERAKKYATKNKGDYFGEAVDV